MFPLQGKFLIVSAIFVKSTSLKVLLCLKTKAWLAGEDIMLIFLNQSTRSQIGTLSVGTDKWSEQFHKSFLLTFKSLYL